MTIEKEVLVYCSLPFKKYRWISYMSVIQIGFLALNTVILPTPRLLKERQEAVKNRLKKKEKSDDSVVWDEYEPNPDYDPSTVWEKIKRLNHKDLFAPSNILKNIVERPYLTLGLLGVSALMTSAFVMYAHRMAHLITLLPNERVRFSSFSAFAIGKPPTIELPVRDVSCVQGRKSKHNYSILKLRGYWGYHLVHKSEGQFLEPKLYDKYLGYERSWAKKQIQ